MNRAPAGALKREPQNIAAMFGAIASRYDIMNRLMTFGLDGLWRRAAVAQAALHEGDRALDVCCGTGDLALALARACPGCQVTALDFSEPMLEVARAKAGRAAARLPAPPRFVHGDLLSLPFDACEFDAVTVAFGVRNVPDLHQAFAQMMRVLRPGGRVVCLEITTPPPGPARWLHAAWMEVIVPRLGGLIAGDASAYSYLPASVRTFPDASQLARLMTGVGLRRVRYRRFLPGDVALHVGEAP